MNSRITLAAAALAGVAVCGCGHPFVPAAALLARPGHPARAARPGKPVLGVDLYAPAGSPLGTVTADGTADMAYLHGTLGAQAVGLVWNLASPGDHSNRVSATAQSLSPAAVATLTRLAEGAGMSVEYRPLIRVGPVSQWNRPTRSWEGFIQPARPRAWFASFFRAELPYLQVAQRLHVREFVVGTELLGIGDSRWWPWFLAKVRSVYHGTVSYAAVMKQYFTAHRRLPPVGAMGLDAYPPLSLPAWARQQRVTAGWERYLGQAPKTLLRRTAMEEVALAAKVGAYRRPADWNAPGRTDLLVQARWFTAACATAARFHMRAVYFYEVRLSPDPAQRLAFPAFFAGKPGARAIRGCVRILDRAS